MNYFVMRVQNVVEDAIEPPLSEARAALMIKHFLTLRNSLVAFLVCQLSQMLFVTVRFALVQYVSE